jgi:hypothetical protein
MVQPCTRNTHHAARSTLLEVQAARGGGCRLLLVGSVQGRARLMLLPFSLFVRRVVHGVPGDAQLPRAAPHPQPRSPPLAPLALL